MTYYDGIAWFSLSDCFPPADASRRLPGEHSARRPGGREGPGTGTEGGEDTWSRPGRARDGALHVCTWHQCQFFQVATPGIAQNILSHRLQSKEQQSLLVQWTNHLNAVTDLCHTQFLSLVGFFTFHHTNQPLEVEISLRKKGGEIEMEVLTELIKWLNDDTKGFSQIFNPKKQHNASERWEFSEWVRR